MSVVVKRKKPNGSQFRKISTFEKKREKYMKRTPKLVFIKVKVCIYNQLVGNRILYFYRILNAFY